ncbi:HNH endonuclease [Pseudomonas sp. GL-R-19]|uniref:HNH endonuclease n=1 Tax=Pseudomonas sp. GL-R-19 TaxID=2832391 RepID=UPI001CBE5D18|nr:HNH endonuclease [Pseudomonas sp. GL-R-19]
MDTENENTGWTDDELAASVDAYLAIQARYPNDEKFSKASEYRILQASVLPGRNYNSIDYRLKNISALFNELGLKTMSAYKPKEHLGSGITARLNRILQSKGLLTLNADTPIADDETPIRVVKRVKKQDLVSEPEGVLIPQQMVSITKSFVRTSKIKKWILANAKGICEGCGQPAPFEKDGTPYLEVHHVKHLVQQGTDRRSNTVALCPNCHRRCHHSSDREEFTASLYTKVKRLKPE